jgi:hypothetical protein
VSPSRARESPMTAGDRAGEALYAECGTRVWERYTPDNSARAIWLVCKRLRLDRWTRAQVWHTADRGREGAARPGAAVQAARAREARNDADLRRAAACSADRAGEDAGLITKRKARPGRGRRRRARWTDTGTAAAPDPAGVRAALSWSGVPAVGRIPARSGDPVREVRRRGADVEILLIIILIVVFVVGTYRREDR